MEEDKEVEKACFLIGQGEVYSGVVFCLSRIRGLLNTAKEELAYTEQLDEGISSSTILWMQTAEKALKDVETETQRHFKFLQDLLAQDKIPKKKGRPKKTQVISQGRAKAGARDRAGSKLVVAVERKEHVPLNTETSMKREEHVPLNTKEVVEREEHAPLNTEAVVAKEEHVTLNTKEVVEREEHAPLNTEAVVTKEEHAPLNTEAVVTKEEHVPLNTEAVVTKEEQAPLNTEVVVEDEDDKAMAKGKYTVGERVYARFPKGRTFKPCFVIEGPDTRGTLTRPGDAKTYLVKFVGDKASKRKIYARDVCSKVVCTKKEV
ncbi:MAG: uncharacterized protein A8A55_0753 [Amphiamblys sp. WSBS2006]|nr:MAG: uncharacterized protein A8A55_0753 [Amphiamblys sp. WSBS2006]